MVFMEGEIGGGEGRERFLKAKVQAESMVEWREEWLEIV
jgi:hypothetical protein